MPVIDQFADLLRGTDPLQLTTRTIVAVAIFVIVKGMYNLYLRKSH